MAEGALAMAFDTWVGPIYLAAWAGKVGLPAEKLPWLTSVPLLGAVAQAFGVAALSSLTSRFTLKWACITLSLISRALWCLAFLLPLGQSESLGPAIGMIAAVSSAVGLTATSFWMSWMKSWVPRRFEGRFWGVRARGSTLGVLSAHGLAAFSFSFALHEPFAVILCVALLSAMGSLWILSRLPPESTQDSTQDTKLSFSVRFKELLSSRSDLRLIGVACLFHAGISLVGPYFPYYFTHIVGLKTAEISIWYGLTQVGMMVSAMVWGKRWDLAFSGNGRSPRQLLRFTGSILALSPLPYVIQQAEILRWIGPIEYFVNGLIWAGFQVGLSTILFRSAGKSDPARATLLFSVMTAAQGVTGALAAWLGSELSQVLAPWGGFQALWVVGTLVRLVIAWWFLPRLI